MTLRFRQSVNLEVNLNLESAEIVIETCYLAVLVLTGLIRKENIFQENTI